MNNNNNNNNDDRRVVPTITLEEVMGETFVGLDAVYAGLAEMSLGVRLAPNLVT